MDALSLLVLGLLVMVVPLFVFCLVWMADFDDASWTNDTLPGEDFKDDCL